MEGYSNYQEVINAIKAEYVNARDLKRKATATGRKTKSTDSFKKRKEVESKSLVDKSKLIDALLDTKLSESVSDLNKSKFKDYKTKLSELEAKLEYIDSESKRFDLLNQIDPEGHKDATQTQEQTFSVLRNLLATAINDTKLAIDNIYNGENYDEIVKATKPNYLTHSEDEVNEYYNLSEMTYVQLFDKAKNAIDNYNAELFDIVNAMRQMRNYLIMQSRNLVDFKSQLATLLENESPQSEIDSKENEIESLKESMLNHAKDLQIADTARNEWIDGKFHNVSVFIDDLYEFQEEFRSYRQNNDSFLTRKPRADSWIKNQTSKLYESLFDALIENTNDFGAINGTNEFDLVWNGLQNARNESVWMESDMNDNYFKLDSLRNNQMFDNVRGGSADGKISNFKKGIKSDYKSFYVDCAKDLFRATNDYMDQKVRKENLKDQVRHYFYKSEEERSNHEKYAVVLSQARRNSLQGDFDFRFLQEGHYVGTQEQEQAYWVAKYNYIDAQGDYEYKKSLVDVHGNKYGVYNTLFPDFFVSLAQYQNSVDAASSSFESALNSYNDKVVTVATAYDYLQTLTVGEADYVAALAAYEKASNELQESLDSLNLMGVDAGVAGDFLQTTLPGETAYQSTVVSTQAAISNSEATIAQAQDDRSTAEVTKSDAQNQASQANVSLNNAQMDSAQAQATIDQAEVSKSNAQATKAQAQSDKADYLAGDHEIDQTIVDGYDSIIEDAQATIDNAIKSILEAQMTIAQAQSDIANAEATIAALISIIDEAQMTIDSALKNIADAQNTIVTANEELRQATDSHYIYLGAQADYDSKIAAKDAYYTDIVSVNQTVKDDAYTFLQDLTDEDDAYQAALKDWTEESNTLVSLAEQKDAASVVLDSANNDLVTSISFTYGEEFNLSISGYELRDAKTALVQAQSNITEASSLKDFTDQALKDAKDVMTFVQATPQEKREGMMNSSELDKRNDQYYRCTQLNQKHSDYLFLIQSKVNEKIQSLGSLGDIDYYLQNLMTFIDGNDQNNRTYINTLRNRMSSEDYVTELNDKMNFYKECISTFGLNSNFASFANTQEDMLYAIQRDNGSQFQSALRETLDMKIQMFPASSFVWAIKDEVNNGNPLR